MNSMLKGLLAAAIASAALAGPALAVDGVTDKEILIGTHLDLSGPVAAGMPQLRNAIQMRIDEANEAGGVNGRKLRIVVEDNGSQPQLAVRAVEKLMRSENVFAFLQPFGSGPNSAVVKRVTDAKIVYFAPWGSSDAIRAAANNSDYLFNIQPNYDTTSAPALVHMIKETGAKKIGHIYQEGVYGDSTKRGVQMALSSLGMTVAAEAGYKVGDIDFSSQVARMRAAGCELVLIGTVIRETVGIMAEVKKIGWTDAKIMTTFGGRTQIAIQLNKEAVEGLYGVAAWKTFSPANPSDEFKAWSAKFKEKFNLVPDENAAVGYANSDWFVKGLQAAGRDLTSEKFKKALQSITFENVIYFSPKTFVQNQAEPQTIRIEQVRNGNWVPVSGPIGPLAAK